MENNAPTGDRIAKVIARAGIASRRDAEKIILDGRVSVNGKVITSPALNVTPRDTITVDGNPLEAPEPPRLWLYHKPLGVVTTARDEQGRKTIFETLPEDMPRVLNIGRLDLNSEGLLLLTNDGGIKRQLELPSTGWLRKYRVRVNGRPSDSDFDTLRKGVTIDGERFQPMEVSLDRQQGANAWLTVGIREGRNREIRRAMEHVGLSVNRLIRVSYGPFQLGKLKAGEVEEVRRKIMYDQLGLTTPDDTGRAKPKDAKPSFGKKFTGRKPTDRKPTDGKPTDRKPFGGKPSDRGPSGSKPSRPKALPPARDRVKVRTQDRAARGNVPAIKPLVKPEIPTYLIQVRTLGDRTYAKAYHRQGVI